MSARRRWGKLFTSAYTIEQVLDALVVLDEEIGLAENLVQREDHTKVVRQLTAAKAREAKLTKQVNALKKQIDFIATTEKNAAKAAAKGDKKS